MEDWKLTTPVVFIIFKRLDTASKVFEQIRRAKPSRLYIISDGARKDHADEQDKVDAVRAYIDTNIDWNCQVERNYSDENMGSRYRIVSGLDWVFSKEEEAIILEDDVVPHKTFFHFCQDMLEHYRDDTRIGLVSGCNMLPDYHSDEQYFFTRMAITWGWATWKRVWNHYNSDVPELEQVKKMKYFENYHDKRYGQEIVNGLDMVIHNHLDAWDYQWAYTIATNCQMGIMPSMNLIDNIGFNSNEATHTKEKSRFKFDKGEMQWPIKYQTKVMHEYQYDRNYVKVNYDINIFKKLYLMIDSYITIHFINK